MMKSKILYYQGIWWKMKHDKTSQKPVKKIPDNEAARRVILEKCSEMG